MAAFFAPPVNSNVKHSGVVAKMRGKIPLILNLVLFVLNLVLLVLNARLYARVRHASSQFEKKLNSHHVASVVHEFVNKTRSGRTDYSFKIHRNWITWDPNVISSGYRLHETSHYESTWAFDVEFEGGYIYHADLRHLGDDRWYLHSFVLRKPAKIALARSHLHTLVNKAHEYMYHNEKNSVRYTTLVDANAFHDRYDSTVAYLGEYCDLPSLEVSETDSQIDIVMPNGYVLSYKFDSLADRVSRGGVFIP